MKVIRMLLSFSVDGNVNWKNISIIKQMNSIYQFLRHCMEFLFLPKWWPIIKLIIRVSINKRAWTQKWIAWFLSLSVRNALECSEPFNSDMGLTKNEETNSCWPQPHGWVTFNSHKNTVGEIFFQKNIPQNHQSMKELKFWWLNTTTVVDCISKSYMWCQKKYIIQQKFKCSLQRVRYSA